MVEAAKTKYSAEREIDPSNCTPSAIMALIAEMAAETGLDLTPSRSLQAELGA